MVEISENMQADYKAKHAFTTTPGIGVQDAGIRLKNAGFFHYLSNPEARDPSG